MVHLKKFHVTSKSSLTLLDICHILPWKSSHYLALPKTINRKGLIRKWKWKATAAVRMMGRVDFVLMNKKKPSIRIFYLQKKFHFLFVSIQIIPTKCKAGSKWRYGPDSITKNCQILTFWRDFLDFFLAEEAKLIIFQNIPK